MRIALITHQWPGVRLGGIGVYTRNCARALVEAGHEAHVFTLTLPEDVRRAVPAGVVMHEAQDFAERIAAGSIPSVMAAGVQAAGEAGYRLAIGAILCDELRRVHAATPFDVVEGPEYEGLMLPLVMAKLEGKVRTVVHLHSGSAIAREAGRIAGVGALQSGTEEELQGAGWKPAPQVEAIEFASVLGADAVCAPSRRVVLDTQRFCAVEDAAVLPLPFFADAVSSRTDIGRGEGAALYVGRLEMVKGAHLLPVAANVFLKRHPEAHLRLAGPDTAVTPDENVASMAAWMRSALDPGVASRVHFLGERNREELTAELARAAFVVVPSLFDSYSYVCCEAMAAGLPVVVSDRIGATEVVGDGGLVFERGNSIALAEAMDALWSDAALRERLGGRALERVKTVLSAEHAIRERIAFYKRCVAEGSTLRTVEEKFEALPARYIGPMLRAVMELTNFVAGVKDEKRVTPGMRLRSILDRVSEETGKPTEVILFGAGRFTSRLLAESQVWESAGHRVVGLIDDHPRFMESPRHLGLRVESMAAFEARMRGVDGMVVVLSTDTFQEQFWEKTAGLRAMGVKVVKL